MAKKKKVWTPAARTAWRAKMVAAMAAKRRRKRNPTKEQVKSAAKKLAKRAASLAWKTAKGSARVAGRAAGAAGRSAAADVKAAICRPRGTNPHRRKRRRNPHPGARVVRKGAIVLRAQRGTQRLYYDGKFFSSKNRAHIFPSVQGAAIVGRAMLNKYPILRGYKLTVFRY
jgi:hypothetical protein